MALPQDIDADDLRSLAKLGEYGGGATLLRLLKRKREIIADQVAGGGRLGVANDPDEQAKRAAWLAALDWVLALPMEAKQHTEGR